MFKKLQNKYIKLTSEKNFAEIISGSSLSFLSKIINLVIGLLFSILITRWYGAEAMGIYSLVTVFMMFAGLISLLGLNTSIVRMIPEYIAKFSIVAAQKISYKFYKIVFFLSLLTAVIAYFSADLIAIYIFKKEFMSFLFTLAALFIVPQALMSLNTQIIRSLKEIKILTVLEVTTSILKVLTLIILHSFISDKYTSVYALFISNFIMAIISAYIVHELFSARIKNVTIQNYYSNLKVKSIFSTSLPMFLTSGMVMLILQIDILMLSMYSTLKDVGIYAVVVKLASLSIFVTAAINTMAGPKFSELFYSNKLQELEKMAKQTTKLALTVSIPLMLLTVLFGKYLLHVFGAEFVEGYETLIILIISLLISTAAGSEGYFLNMTGHERAYNKILLFSVFVNIVVNYFLIPIYGMEGAAIASLISKGIWMLIASLYIKKKFGFYICYVPFVIGHKA